MSNPHGLPRIDTERLVLRRWTCVDRVPFAAINAEPAVARFLPCPLTREQSDAFIDRIEAHFDKYGYGLWAVERRDTSELIGFVGLQPVTFVAEFTPSVEIGWRLASSAWGNGFATEAATAVAAAAFERLDLDELVSFTVPANTASIAVMRRLGMRHDPTADFDHPHLPLDSPLRRHVLYRLARSMPMAEPAARGTWVHDLRHATSYELRPDPALDARLRELASQLEGAGLIKPGASTSPRFHPHLTLLRARLSDRAALTASAARIVQGSAAVTLETAGTFGDGRIIWLGPTRRSTLLDARRALLQRIDHADVDPLVSSRSWTPHLTIAYAVPETHRSAALEVVRAALPMTGTWSSLETWQLDERPTRRTARELLT